MSPVCLALGVLFVRPHNDQTRSDVSCPDAKISRLNGWPAGSPVNASSRTSQCATHDSGPVWFAIPSLLETFTLYSLSISRRTSVRFFPFRDVRPLVILAVLHEELTKRGDRVYTQVSQLTNRDSCQ